MTVLGPRRWLGLFPPFQRAGELRLSGTALREIAARRQDDALPLAYLFASCDDPPPAPLTFRLGRYSRRHQVWEFDPTFGGSSELVPPNRRLLQS